MSFPYQLSDRTLTVYIDNNTYQTDRTNAHWGQIKAALNDPTTTNDQMIALMKPINAIASALSGQTEVTVVGSQVMYGNEVVHPVLADRILDVLGEGFDIDPWLRFATNVYANPYDWSREELYLFLEKANLPITDDGCFIAYKKVRSNYKDINSGTFDNSIGRIVSMPREEVDPDRNNTCSTGLHFCSKDYLPSFSGGSSSRVVLVKINPADVVSIPSDYSNTKGRTWRYEVVGEIDEAIVREMLWPAVSRGYEDHQWGPEDDLDDDFDDDGSDYGWLYGDDDNDDNDDHDEPSVEVTATDNFTVIADAVASGFKAAKVIIETIANGEITEERLTALLKKHGTKAEIARKLGVSSGTVQAWFTRIFGPAK